MISLYFLLRFVMDVAEVVKNLAVVVLDSEQYVYLMSLLYLSILIILVTSRHRVAPIKIACRVAARAANLV